MTMRIRIRQHAMVLIFAIFVSLCPHVSAQSDWDPHWLLEYQGPYKGHDLKWDKRFKPFIDHYLRMKQNIVPRSPAMSDVVSLFLGVPGEYRGDGDSFFYADGCVAHACPDKGLIWVDLKSTPPTVVFAALADTPGSKAAGVALYIFASRELQAGDFPDSLRTSINDWASKPLADGTYDMFGRIQAAVIAGPDGRERSIDLTAAGVPSAAQEKAANQ